MKDRILQNVENLMHCNYYAAVQFLARLQSVSLQTVQTITE
jgi:hypothetical protein